MNKKRFDVRALATLSLLTGILLIMSYTPLGYLNIGPLAITLNMIPVAVAAVAFGPKGGAITGAVFGITSFLQCIGIGGFSAMGVVLFEISPVLSFVQRFFPRLFAGILAGLVFMGMKKLAGATIAGYTTGLCAALLNTVLFMSALVLLFGRTEYVQGLMGGQNVLLFICSFIGINAIVEMLVTTLVTGLLCNALEKTRLLGRE